MMPPIPPRPSRTARRWPWQLLRVIQRILLVVIVLWGLVLFIPWLVAFARSPDFGALLLQVVLLSGYLLFFLAFQMTFVFFVLGRARVAWLRPHELQAYAVEFLGNTADLNAARQIVPLLRNLRATPSAGTVALGGLLLTGPAGTGKRQLVQMIAAEAGVPYGYLSAASLKTSRLGMGPLKVAMTYRRARKLANEYGACVLVIDEFDTLADGSGTWYEVRLQNSSPLYSGGRWSNLGRWLTLEGAPSQTGRVLTVGIVHTRSTALPEPLTDHRFTRHITTNLPDATARRALLVRLLANTGSDMHTMPAALNDIVAMTEGYTPAALHQLVNEAQLYAQAEQRPLRLDDIQRTLASRTPSERTAPHAVEPAAAPVGAPFSIEEQRRIAYHKAGAAYVWAQLQPRLSGTETVTIELGPPVTPHALHAALERLLDPDQPGYSALTRHDLENALLILLAGRAATSRLLGVELTAAAEDLRQATQITTLLVSAFGMGGQLFSYLTLSEQAWEQALQSGSLHNQIEHILRQQAQQVAQLIEHNREAVVTLAEALLLREVLTLAEIERLIQTVERDHPPVPMTAEQSVPRRVRVARRYEPQPVAVNGQHNTVEYAEEELPPSTTPAPVDADEPSKLAETPPAPVAPAPPEPVQPADESPSPATRTDWSALYGEWGPPPPSTDEDNEKREG
ncbi:MAG: AAA family ATPase [Chloroflexaceae bacterium]|nr:AAA family ATPase [Chloroflexaceae bacterium]